MLVHCAAGKDRTGLIAALLLGLAGVLAETIAADYAMTAEALRPQLEAWLDSDLAERAEREALLARYAPTAEVMLEVLARLADGYGGVEPYLLLEAGVPAAGLDLLRGRLIVPALDGLRRCRRAAAHPWRRDVTGGR